MPNKTKKEELTTIEENPFKVKNYDYITYMGLPIPYWPQECLIDGLHYMESITVRGCTYEPGYARVVDGKLKQGMQPHLMMDC